MISYGLYRTGSIVNYHFETELAFPLRQLMIKKSGGPEHCSGPPPIDLPKIAA
jgi:hypothetical protein